MNKFSKAIIAGAAGAAALTTVHELARGRVPHAPRMDVLGKRAVARLTERPLTDERSRDLERLSLAGDLLANSMYYALVGAGTRRRVWQRGAMLGAAAGAGALVLPERIGLGRPPDSDAIANQIMTVAWYLVGGIAAACTFEWLAGSAGD